MAISKSKKKHQELECPNCTYPFLRNEKFCPECGQKNQGEKLEFRVFIGEIFKGFTSWDTKFWKTIIPLISKPGKVPEQYINGKRNRYVNPFRFYMTISIIFFLTIGAINAFNKFDSFRKGGDTFKTDKQKSEVEAIQDSVASELDIELKDNKILRLVKFQEKHPDLSINSALDSLSLPKTFSNKFWYSRANLINAFSSNSKESSRGFAKEVMSYVSITLFILLPIFCLFLKLLYIKNKYSYIEHLIFIFYTQSIFFVLFAISYLVMFFIGNSNILLNLFIPLFLVYLFLAMKRFYKQSYSKTFLRFCLANIVYLFLSVIGLLCLLMITFAIY